MLLFLEGRDNVGKTTLIKILKNRNPNFIFQIISKINITSEEWFSKDVKSIVDLFFDNLDKDIGTYSGLQMKIYIFDKGPLTYLTRLTALLEYRNSSENDKKYLRERFDKTMLKLKEAKFIWIVRNDIFDPPIINKWSIDYKKYQRILYKIDKNNIAHFKEKIHALIVNDYLLESVAKIETFFIENFNKKLTTISTSKFIRNSLLWNEKQKIEIPDIPKKFKDDFNILRKKYNNIEIFMSGSCLYGLNKKDSDLDLLIIVPDEYFQTICENIYKLEFKEKVGINIIGPLNGNLSVKHAITLWVHGKIDYENFIKNISFERVLSEYEYNKMLFISNKTKGKNNKKQFYLLTSIILEMFGIFEPNSPNTPEILSNLISDEKDKKITHENIVVYFKKIERLLWKEKK